MERIDFSLDELPSPKPGLTLALGNFDGFHLGHRDLALAASSEGSPSGILLFDHPYKVSSTYLSDVEDKIRFSYVTGLEYAYVLHCEDSFYELSKDDFMELLKRLGAKTIVIGEDFLFGKSALGTPEDLKRGFKVIVVPTHVDSQGHKISSSNIKLALSKGQIEEANSLLGHPYEIKGTVVHGLENGRKIGFPTCNLGLSFPYILPEDGVYCGLVYLSGVPYRAMINVGVNPTIGKLSSPLAEAHIIDGQVEAYGKRAYFRFYKKIRDEVTFSSLSELQHQLSLDKEAVEDYFDFEMK